MCHHMIWPFRLCNLFPANFTPYEPHWHIRLLFFFLLHHTTNDAVLVMIRFRIRLASQGSSWNFNVNLLLLNWILCLSGPLCVVGWRRRLDQNSFGEKFSLLCAEMIRSYVFLLSIRSSSPYLRYEFFTLSFSVQFLSLSYYIKVAYMLCTRISFSTCNTFDIWLHTFISKSSIMIRSNQLISICT